MGIGITREEYEQDLSRVRAEGRLEGIRKYREAIKDKVYATGADENIGWSEGYDAAADDAYDLGCRLIAAAERELEGRRR